MEPECAVSVLGTASKTEALDSGTLARRPSADESEV